VIDARYRLLGFAALAALIVACGGGGGSATTPPTGGSTTPQQVMMQLVIPAALANASAKLRHAFALSQSTNGAGVNIYTSPKSSNPTAVFSAGYDLSATSSLCTVNATTQGRTCNVSMAISPGTYDFEVKTFAQALPTSSPVLALGYGIVAAQTVTAGSSLNVGVSIGGIVGSANVTLPFPKVHQLDSSTQVITVAVMDNAHNTIVSNGFYDLNGNPVTVNIADAIGRASFSPSTISAPGTQVTMTYSPPATWTAAALGSVLNDGIITTLSSGQPPLTSAHVTGDAPIAVFTPFPTSNTPTGIASGGDGRLWVTLHPVTGPDTIAAVNTQTGVGTTYGINGMGSSPLPIDITYNSGDNNVWFSAPNNNYAGEMNTSGVMAGSPQAWPFNGISGPVIPRGIASSGQPGSPAYGLWVTDAGTHSSPMFTVQAVQVNTGTVNYGNANITGTSQYIARGADGRMWFTEPANNKIGAIDYTTPSLGNTTEYVIASGTQPWGICPGPDGNMWFTEQLTTGGFYHVGRITPAGIVTEVALPATTSSQPYRCAAGTDGNIWFSFLAPTAYVARVNPTTLAVTMYPTPAIFPSISTDSLASGVDGDMWITDANDDALLRVIP
jgi:hypothetical protein